MNETQRILQYRLEDAVLYPNNPRFPLLFYPLAVILEHAADPPKQFETLFY